MRIRASKPSSKRGSALMIALVVTGLVGFVLAAYLTLLSAQNETTMRSQAWNSSMPVVEAGCEDALNHLNIHGKTNLHCDGWALTNSEYFMSRWVSTDTFYNVAISNFPANPVIIALGYVPMPRLVSTRQEALPVYAFISSSALNKNANPQTYIVRGVRLTARRSGIFVKAMVARNSINLGGNVLTDSFDSGNPLYSSNGFYTVSKRRDHGDVASDGQLVKEITSSGQVKIYGHISTGPGGSVGMSGSASIGGRAWVDGGAPGIEKGWFRDDMNMAFPDADPPFTGGAFAPLQNQIINGTNYAFVLNGGNYTQGSVTLNLTQKLLVTGNAVLYVPGDFKMFGSSGLIIAPGASLKLYVGGANGILNGQGVMNGTGFATNFVYYGLPGNTNISLSGGTAFTGLIYAPRARLNVSGYTVICGATVTESVSASLGFAFHYDESLAGFGVTTPYVVSSWNELAPSEIGGAIVTLAPVRQYGKVSRVGGGQW